MQLHDRVALITGAGGPMGAAIARRFAAAGATLVLTDISANRLAAAVTALREAVPEARILAQRASVLVETEAQAVAAAGLETFGRIDVLVNVVGGIRSSDLAAPILTMSEDRWDSTFALNLKGNFHLVRAAGPGMVAQAYGRIINISSVTYAGDLAQPEYAAAKAAVASFTRSLAMELAPHVTVNCIAPGLIETSVLDRAPPALVQSYIDRTLLKRLGRPEDIAAASLFLASDDAAYITGAILPVSGGIWPAL